MALSDAALTDVATARLWVKRSPSKDQADPLLELLINGYSAAIHRYTGRQFKPKEDAKTKVFRYDGSGVLYLDPYELRTVTSIVAYSDWLSASWRTLDPGSATTISEYRLEPRNKTEEATFWWLALPETTPTWRNRHVASQITITGDWGVNSVPDDVELACLIAVANGYRNPANFASQSLGELSFSEVQELTGGTALPPASRALLSPFRRVAV